MTKSKFGSRAFVAIGLATLAISALFLGMIWDFLITLVLAAIFSALSLPLQNWVLGRVGQRPGVAAGITLAILLTGVLAPILAIVYLVADQAAELSAQVEPFAQRIRSGELVVTFPDSFPFKSQVEVAFNQIAGKVGELSGKLASFLVSTVSAATKGTASFFLQVFILCYAMIFFLQDETNVLAKAASYSGLPREVQTKLVDRTMAVSRSTIKGTLVISLVQGALGAVGFAFAGIPGAAFWGAVIAVLGVIPGIGPTVVWIPAR